MGTRNAETNQGESGLSSTSAPSAPAQPVDQIRSRAGNQIFKSGPLFISSKGIGWTSWKKRWFILTRTSLVFFRSDPSVIPQKGSEVNLTLGGIDLNSSGSVVVKEDKKLLTVLFPDGRDGRAFTLKAETLEDLYEWKAALENALAQAPSAALVMGQNGIFRNEPTETAEGGSEQSSDRQPVKSLVIGRPILLALEDIDGAPSFLEKALTFIEQHGIKVEGILRQSAAVDDVNRRVREYEEGKNEFSPDEDAHLIADCVKHVLRALPSSPVPASCCNALLEACRADRGGRINAMRAAIAETFPEPNLRLLQRILKMMQVVVSHKSENRMSCSAVSACMAPLLLRPLLAGECELEHDFNMGGDGSAQLLQAAAAANHAQAIVITLMEEYDKIFGECNLQEGSVYSGSEESGSEEDELTDDDEILEDDEDNDTPHNVDGETEDEGDEESGSDGTISENSCTDDDQSDNKVCVDSNSELGSVDGDGDVEANQLPSGRSETSSSKNDSVHSDGENPCITSLDVHSSESRENVEDFPASRSLDQTLSPCHKRSTVKSNEFPSVVKRRTVWGRTSARKNLSMESIDFNEDEVEIQKLELTKNDLQSKIAVEVRENADLHACLENKKKALHERRLALEQDVFGLQEQLRRERELRETMETRLNKPLERSTIPLTIDDKTKAELEDISQAEEDIANLKKKVADLYWQLNQQSNNDSGVVCGACGQSQQKATNLEQQDRREDRDATVSSSLPDKSRKCEDGMSRTDGGNVRTEETSYLQKKHSFEKKQMDSTTDSAKSRVDSGNARAEETPYLQRKHSSEKKQMDFTTDSAKSRADSGNARAEETSYLQKKLSSEKKQMDFTTDSSKSRADSGNARTEETSYIQKKPSSEKRQMDSTTDSAKSLGTAGSSYSVDSVSAASSASSNSKKSGSKAEGPASTSSALSKLTTRLNFLKERRSQIVNELQNIENSRGSSESSLIVAPPKVNPR